MLPKLKSPTPWGVMKVGRGSKTSLYIIKHEHCIDDDGDQPLAKVFSNEDDAKHMAMAPELLQVMAHVSNTLSNLDVPLTNRDASIERCIMFLNDALKKASNE